MIKEQEGVPMAENANHPGISMHKLPVGAGFGGLVFTIGSVVIFLLGLPSLWYFVAFSAALGIGIAAILHLTNSNRSEKLRPLSILSTPVKAESPEISTPDKKRNLWHALPTTHPA
jgi:hypothetical protein